MPRAARRKSESGIYHIILRGINKQVIFEDEEDFSKFLETLKNYKAISEYKIFAYCLMSNHIHLLLKVEKEDLDLIMKRIAGSYVYWYNWKYKRKGHLFQDRFKSEPVDDDAYFLTVIRYIHQNPIKAGVSKFIDRYKYSSYNNYVETPEFVDTDFCLSMIDLEQFIQFNKEYNDDVCLELEADDYRMTDEEARTIIKKVSKCNTAAEFQLLSIDKRNKFIKILREQGLSIRQISRLTGISFNIVRKF
ncbi:MAG: transposase [Ruminococcaceae bacterium]|nr:transposase [Oscillospiraceae bacterium]